jgi:hypothetical protein
VSERRRHSRWPLLGLVIAVVATVTLAVTGAAKQMPGLEFVSPGHWIASPALGLILHVDGATKQSDAQVKVPGVQPGSQVLQDESRGYVVGKDDVTIFGKSTLSVESTAPLPVTGGKAVQLTTAGGTYLIYPERGQIVRFGLEQQVVSAGGPLGPAVATSDGTMWVHRTDSGALCKLARGATNLPCPAVVPAGHTGGLTVSADKVLFVDTTADTVSTVSEKGLGPAVKLGVDAPPNARIAPVDAAGKIAVLDPATNRMHLVDAHVDDKGALAEPRQPASVQLPAGEYDGPSVSGESVVVLDHKNNSVRTYDNEGHEKHNTPIPPENGKPVLHRGEDARVYVDGGEGKHVVVVDKDGSVSPVPITGEKKPDEHRKPVPPPAEPPVEKPSDKPSDRPVPPPNTGRPVPPPVQTQPPRTAQPPQTPPPIPVTPPGMPQNLQVAISTKQVDATVTWSAAPANGAPVTAYHVSWQSEGGGRAGNQVVSGSTFSYVIKDIWKGTDYPFTVSVVAQNSAGMSPPAVHRKVPPPSTKKITLSQGPLAPECGREKCYWMHIVMTGFESETFYNAFPHSTDPGYSNEGHGETTDGQGHKEFNAFYYYGVGHEVWVTIDGVTSNRITWQE